jgi:hypothetical protein
MFISTILAQLTAAQEDIKASQKDLEAGLINVIASRELYPVPGRALRNLVASCFLTLYTHGDSKNMFDTLIAFLKVASDFKAAGDRDQHKMLVPFLYFLTTAVDPCVPERHYTALAS